MKTTLALLALAVAIGGGTYWYLNFGPDGSAPQVEDIPPPPPEELVDDGAGGRDEAPAIPTANPDDVVVVASQGIDWTQAQADIAAQREAAGEAGLAQVASAGGDLSPVPILLPTGIVQPANASPPGFKTTSDGYIARFEGVAYDIVMNGTSMTYGKVGEDVDARPDYRFELTDAGAQIALSRYGADYLIEFECNILEENNSCITEEEAVEVANNLIVTGGR